MRRIPTFQTPRPSGACQSRSAALLALACVVFAAGCSADAAHSGEGPEATLKSPAAGDLIAIGTQQPIEWDLSAEVAAVDISIHFPDGRTEVIAEGTPNDGSFSWNVPLLPGADQGSYSLGVSHSGESPGSASIGGVEKNIATNLAVGSIAGFKWNGASEDYYWVDLLTGESKVLGAVGDMMYWEWKGGSAFDASSGLIYIVASPNDTLSVWKVYSLDAATGALVRDAEIQGTHPSSIRANAAGKILGMSWNGAKEEISSLDPVTGDVTVLGTVGNLSVWSMESAVDTVNDRFYVLGVEDPDFDPMGQISGPNAAWSVYTLDASTGALLDTKPLADQAPEKGISGLATTSQGELVGFRWNGAAEEMVVIDPATGSITPRGTVGDLLMWSGYTAANPTTDVIHVFGQDPAGTTKLYTVDTTSGALLYDVAVTDTPTTTLLVY